MLACGPLIVVGICNLASIISGAIIGISGSSHLVSLYSASFVTQFFMVFFYGQWLGTRCEKYIGFVLFVRERMVSGLDI